MKTNIKFAVRIENEEQFNQVVAFNESKGLKAKQELDRNYSSNRNCVDLTNNFNSFNEWVSPLAFDRHVISFDYFQMARLALLN